MEGACVMCYEDILVMALLTVNIVKEWQSTY